MILDAMDVGELLFLDFQEFGAATYETENDFLIAPQAVCGFQEGVQGMAGAVVAGVHDYELAG